MNKIISILIILFTLLSWSSNGQAPYFQHYFLLRKNEPVHVNTIFQDKSGFIWYGTNKGLFKFDGTSRLCLTKADSLPDINVTAIAEDTIGRIWAGFKNGALAYIDKGVVKKFEPEEGNSTKEISRMLFDHNGNLWYSTLGDGLYYYLHGRMYRLDEDEKMPDIYIYDIALDQHGNIWAGTDGGVAICTLNDKGVSMKTLTYRNGLPDNIIKKLFPGADGSMWMGTEDAGIIQFDPSSGKSIPLIEAGWKYGAVSNFLISGNQFWISCQQKGLMVYDRKKQKMKIYDSKVDPDLTTVNTLLKDSEGNIWTGCRSGVMRTPGDFVEYIESFGLGMDANVLALAIDGEDNVWFSTGDGLFKRSVDNSGSVKVVKQLDRTPFAKSTVISLYFDHDGFLWAGLFGQGAIRMNPSTGKIKTLKKELRDGNILNISGKGDVVWLATLGGVSRVEISGEQLNVKNYGISEGLTSEYVYQVFTDSKNRVWFASDGKGVDMLDQQGIHNFTDGFESKVVYGFAEDFDHTVWANVQGEGLFRFDGKKFEAGSSLTSLRNNNVYCLTTDKSGDLVVMHDLGIDLLNTRTNTINSLGDEVGIHDKVPNLNAVTKDRQGRIFFGTDRGIIVYSDYINLRTATPTPAIDWLKVVDKKVGISKDLSFRYDENDITINYVGFWYQNPDNLNFRYKLENYDRDWITSKNHSVTYSSLPPGEYVFHLQVTDLSEFRSAKSTTLKFTVHPPFWKTPGFYILSIATLVMIVFTVIKYRERKLQRDKRILELKNTELKKTNMELDKFVYSVSHDLRAPLSSMLGVVEISQDETEEPLMREHLNYLKGSILKLDGFIKDILDYSRNSRLALKKEEIDFKEMLSDITNNLKYVGGNNRMVDIRLDIDDKIPFHSDRSRISVVLNNIISNSIRYQNPAIDTPLVNIKVETYEKGAQIVVQDNGIGITRNHQEKIFDMFYRVSEASVGSGLGLYIVKENVEKLNGKIAVESEPGVGTAFSINIPNN